jgi:hypothetical protein
MLSTLVSAIPTHATFRGVNSPVFSTFSPKNAFSELFPNKPPPVSVSYAEHVIEG